MNTESMNKKYIIPTFAAIFITAMFIKNPGLTSAYVRRGLESCFLTIIPSLFPFMVVSEILNECGALSAIGRIFGNWAERLFGISKKTLAAVFSGLVLGFPIGTRALIRLYDSGQISENELHSALGFCGIPSFGFIVNVVGISLFAEKKFGLMLYGAAIFSALLSGCIFAKRKKPTLGAKMIAPRTSPKSSAEIITDSISSATGATVILCAYVVFFSCLIGCLSDSIGFSPTVGALTGAILELSTGATASADASGLIGITLVGFTVGWSGLSVHFQTMALVGTRIKSYAKYFIEKLFQGFLCAALAWGYSLFMGFDASCSSSGVSAFVPIFTPEYTAIIIVSFILCVISGAKSKKALA